MSPSPSQIWQDRTAQQLLGLLGIPSATPPIGQLHQSPPSPIPGAYKEVPVTSLTYSNIETRMDRPKSVVRVIRGVASMSAVFSLHQVLACTESATSEYSTTSQCLGALLGWPGRVKLYMCGFLMGSKSILLHMCTTIKIKTT